MRLLMNANGERCQATTGTEDEVYIGSFECACCKSCNQDLLRICPNCQGELIH